MMQQQQTPGETYQVISGEKFHLERPLLFYQIQGRPAFTYGDIFVQPDQRVLTNGGAMLWMDGSLNIDTECYGGCLASTCRCCTQETCCMNQYWGVGKLSVGFRTPGDMLAFAVTDTNGWMLSHSAFVAGTSNLLVSAKFIGCLPCLCSDEGLCCTTVEIDPESQVKQGVFLAGSYGVIERHEVPSGKTLCVGRGNFFACDVRKDLSMSIVGGLKNCLFAAGLKSFVFVFQGPCVVYTQSRNPKDLLRMQAAAGGRKQGKGNRQQRGGRR